MDLNEANMSSPNIKQGDLVARRMEIYGQMLDRKASTFSKATPMFGIIWMASSPTEEDDVINERICQVKMNGIRNEDINDGVGGESYRLSSTNVKILDNIAWWVEQGLSAADFKAEFGGYIDQNKVKQYN